MSFTFQIEISVVGHVDDGIGGGPSAEAEVQLVVIVEGVTCFGHHLTRVTCFAVGTEIGEQHALAFDAAGPLLVGEANGTAVEVMLPIAGVQIELIFNIVDLKATIGNTVGETSGDLACARAVAIIRQRIRIAQHDVVEHAVAVGSHNADDARTDVAQLHLDAVGVGHRVELDVLPVRGLAPGFNFDVHGCLIWDARRET